MSYKSNLNMKGFPRRRPFISLSWAAVLLALAAVCAGQFCLTRPRTDCIDNNCKYCLSTGQCVDIDAECEKEVVAVCKNCYIDYMFDFDGCQDDPECGWCGSFGCASGDASGPAEEFMQDACMADWRYSCGDGTVQAPEECDRDQCCASCYAVPSDYACNDGNLCTHTDVCDASGNCAGTPYTCSDCKSCDGLGGCELSSNICNIGGSCYPSFSDFKYNPSNPCEVCDDDTPTAWTPISDSPCDDGNACTVGDTCTAGSCAGSAYSCAAGGCETCDGAGSCLIDPGWCSIGGACIAEGTPKPSDPSCSSCNTTASTSQWTRSSAGPCAIPCPMEGVSCNDQDNCTAGDTCTTGLCSGTPLHCAACETCAGDSCTINAGFCNIGGTCYVAGSFQPGSSCRTCQPGVSTSSWTALAVGSSCSDGNSCTVDDQCTAIGACVGDELSCECHVTGCSAGSCGDFLPGYTDGCVCASAHEPDGPACEPCPCMTFKGSIGNSQCSPCPEGMVSDEGSVRCYDVNSPQGQSLVPILSISGCYEPPSTTTTTTTPPPPTTTTSTTTSTPEPTTTTSTATPTTTSTTTTTVPPATTTTTTTTTTAPPTFMPTSGPAPAPAPGPAPTPPPPTTTTTTTVPPTTTSSTTTTTTTYPPTTTTTTDPPTTTTTTTVPPTTTSSTTTSTTTTYPPTTSSTTTSTTTTYPPTTSSTTTQPPATSGSSRRRVLVRDDPLPVPIYAKRNAVDRLRRHKMAKAQQ